SFNKLLLQKEELEQKHLHLLQIVESEKTAKWQYTQQCEELTFEIKKLRSEVGIYLSSGKTSTLNVGEKNTSNAKKISSPSTKLPPSPTTASVSIIISRHLSFNSLRHLITVNGMKGGNTGTGTSPNIASVVDMEKIKKVQSFFRGWLCRRRWKQIVEEYIKSPHAESMRKRNRYFLSF
ncbi:GSCOCG00007730001-RA-CDS, partial [Cotesia congregata]